MASAAFRITSVITFVIILAIGEPARADEYPTLARSLASPLFNNWDEANKGLDDSAVILRVEIARQRLMSLIALPADLSSVHTNSLVRLNACNRSMEELRRLDKRMPDFAGIAGKALNASPALFRDKDPETGETQLTPGDQEAIVALAVKGAEEIFKAGLNAWQASGERDNYRTNYSAARLAGLALKDVTEKRSTAPRPYLFGVGIQPRIADTGIFVDAVTADGPAARAGIQSGDQIVSVDDDTVVKTTLDGGTTIDQNAFFKLRGDYGTTTKLVYLRDGATAQVNLTRELYLGEAALLKVDLNGSWDATYANDDLHLRNDSSKELTNCTIVVNLEGTHGENDDARSVTHLHYADSWPAGEWRLARYMASGATGIARDQSIDMIRRVTIELYSDQYRNTITYDYVGTAEFDDDIQAYLAANRPLFDISFSKDNFFRDASVWVTHDRGLSSFPIKSITATIGDGFTDKAVAFTTSGRKWSSGYLGGKSLKSKEFNGIDPIYIELKFEFVGSNYLHIESWTAGDFFNFPVK
jgi:hypothetical protein